MKYNLKRFLEAQERSYPASVDEFLSHNANLDWYWYVLPIMRGEFGCKKEDLYGISSPEEATTYINNPILNTHLREMTQDLLSYKGNQWNIFSKSFIFKSMTLFDAISPNDIYAQVLDKYFSSDWNAERTLDLLMYHRYATIDGITYQINIKKHTALVTRGENIVYEGDIVIPPMVVFENVIYNVVGIDRFAFFGCSSLKTIILPLNIISIGDYAFSFCFLLSSIKISRNVSFIGERTFWGCTWLSSIVVDPANKKYDSRGNCNAIIESETNILISGCKNTIIPNDISIIGPYAFSMNKLVRKIDIPDSVHTIDQSAFYGCSSLCEIKLPKDLKHIGGLAFGRCTSLLTLKLPVSLETLHPTAFNNLKPYQEVWLTKELKESLCKKKDSMLDINILREY